MTHIPGYVQTLFFAVLFLVFINADIGWALVYIVTGTNVLSAVSFLLSRKRFTAELRELSGVTECGRSIEFEVTLRKKGFCFIPYVEVRVDAEQSVCLRTALLFHGTVTVKGSVRAAHSGLNRVELKGVVIGDFLGNIRCTLPFSEKTQMAVLPRIVEYDGPDVAPNTLPSEEEDAEEGASVIQGGMAGYEHREYVPGDSPRRVNYKLSAKRGRLMVRLDESAGCASTNLYIAENAMPVCCDKAFALAGRLIIRGGTVKITHKGESRTASTPETLAGMREWLAFREFADSPDSPPDSSFPSDTAVIFAGNGEIIV